MAPRRVSFTDFEKTEHAAEVEAEYEAVALAVAAVLRDGPDPMTEFAVAVLRNPTEHKIRLNRDGLAGITKRARVQSLLGAIENSGRSASQ